MYAPGVGACGVGGPLSHSSVLAREYGIPAVLGTGAATERLRDGQRIVVDGEAGVLTPGRPTITGSGNLRTAVGADNDHGVSVPKG
ncbi:PEP-utilizing enzyme [Streptosporangium roseum]|uniref:PEP-utilizing enzyme n=1 Tax=Streptosporangium roseum TaxID=2001 RepID=UPI00332F5B86